MATYRVTGVAIERLESEFGLWCNACMLSTGIFVTFVVRFGDKMHLQDRMYCYGCESGKHVVRAAPDEHL